MIIERMQLKDLMPAGYHPRKNLKPGDQEYEQIKTSLVNFGYVEPIVWNRQTGSIVGGLQRLKILIELGIDEEDVSVVDLPLGLEAALNLALNKLQGGWDMDLLKQTVTMIESMNVDLSLTGFNEIEIEKLLGRNIVEDDFDAEAEAAKIKTPSTRRGDIYSMGTHLLMCGDTGNTEDMALLMDGAKASMIFTDPPYNVNYGASLRDKVQKKTSPGSARRKILNDNFKTNEEFYQFLRASIASLRPYAAGDVYICMSSSELHTLQRAFLDCGGHFSTYIIWVKNHFTLGRANYQRQYEPILYGWFEETSHYWSGARNLSDIYGQEKIQHDLDGTPLVRVEPGKIEGEVWEFPRPGKSPEHPTMKPIGLCARGVLNSSRPRDIVLEGFGGSGSTLMACEQTERACRVMELSEVYCDVIIKRWEAFTGKTAERIRRA